MPHRSKRTRQQLRWLAATAAAVLAIALLWRFTPLTQWLKPQYIAQRLQAIEGYGWSPFAFIAAYILGGLVVFPVTVLSAATAIIFPPLKAIPISFAGITLSAALLHKLGARFIRGRAKKALGPTIDRVDKALTDHGIITIATLRMIPLAPFTLVNLAAGASGVSFRDYMLGTALGLAPGVLVLCLFGRQIREIWKHPTPAAIITAAGFAIAWIAMSVALQRWATRRAARLRQQKRPAA